MKDKLPKVDLSKLSTYSLHERKSKVSLDQFGKPLREGAGFREFIDSLPDILAAGDLKQVAQRIVDAHTKGRMVCMAIGAHVIKVGLSPVLIDLIERGVIGAMAFNGACLIHDFELAVAGKTSEDVGEALDGGSFGMSRETATMINRFIADGDKKGLGLGEAVGRGIDEGDFPHKDLSILAACVRKGIPATVSVAIGTDIIHMHDSADGAAMGKTALSDFRTFVRVVSALEGGIFLNVGSAVLLPEVFLKAISAARNLGYPVRDLVTVNMDFIQHYRGRMNVVERPVSVGGKGYSLTGHHEIMLPLLAAAVLCSLD